MNREQEIKRLQAESFDVLIVGGGATGAGVALDAVSRGLKAALVEKNDFGSGTSSRSTKLVHGGVRYLEQAVLQLDRSQFRLVRDALRERKTLLENAPHLVRWLPLLVPMYRRFQMAYYHAGLRMYDWLAGRSLVHRSRLVSKAEALKLCPQLKRPGLQGGVIYYDGQFDDARMNLAILMRAQDLGAAVANYVSVEAFEKTEGKITGVRLRDCFSEKTWTTPVKAVVNATGPFTDSIRLMDNPKMQPILRVSSGAHITLKPLQEAHVGILIPKTSDKRVLFVLPWLGHTLVGTTDKPAEISEDPKATEEDISFILKEYSGYFDPPLTRKDVLSAWCGLRPLIDSAGQGTTARLSRDHHLETSPSGLTTITGGKWTTYRLMAEDAIDEVLHYLKIKDTRSKTKKIPLWGGKDYVPELLAKLVNEQSLPEDIAQHLLRTYGDQAPKVASVIQEEGDRRLVQGHPFTEGEAIYSIREEAARSVEDLVNRRTRLGFLDTAAAEKAKKTLATLLEKEGFKPR